MMLEAEKLCAWYGAAQILFDVSLTVGAGEVVALMGRNGSGKTTTMKAIMGLVGRRAGSVRFQGQDLIKLKTFQIAQLGVGWVPEDRRIFTDLTLAENLEVGRRSANADKAWTPERLFELFPNLAEMRERPGGRMSGGEQQMLTVARTLMGNPRLVLLDEPSEGVAPLVVERMADTILGRRLRPRLYIGEGPHRLGRHHERARSESRRAAPAPRSLNPLLNGSANHSFLAPLRREAALKPFVPRRTHEPRS